MTVYRKVLNYERYYPKSAPAGGSAVILKLECGHTNSRKGSVRIPWKAKCRECDRQETGSGSRAAREVRSVRGGRR
jgi:hypothetical protein